MMNPVIQTDVEVRRSGSAAGPVPARRPLQWAFTLIELLVVIAIIGVLAGLSLGVGGAVSRRAKEKRIESELNKLVTLIESYKTSINMYPPDNIGKPLTNQLFYELTGMLYVPPNFQTVNRQETISQSQIKRWFGTEGFANSARELNNVKFTRATDFKTNEYARISNDVVLLIAPLPGPPNDLDPSGKLNPWRYVSSSPTNNNTFDLWVDVVIGGKTNRFCNWSKQPLPL